MIITYPNLRIAKSCHAEGALVLVQIVHAGMHAMSDSVYSASTISLSNGKQCMELTIDKIKYIKKAFVSAALRAKKAGLDGIEIHGAHGYLLNQFTSKIINNRKDNYGGDLENRLRLSLEIVDKIRSLAGRDFIISYRLGVNDPTLEEDKYFAKRLEEAGVNLLNISGGIGYEEVCIPQDFPLSIITYLGTQFHKEVQIPVACVFGIKASEQADYLLKNDMIDMVAIGRGLLADYAWVEKAINSKPINLCYSCKPKCKFTIDGRLCPRYSE